MFIPAGALRGPRAHKTGTPRLPHPFGGCIQARVRKGVRVMHPRCLKTTVSHPTLGGGEVGAWRLAQANARWLRVPMYMRGQLDPFHINLRHKRPSEWRSGGLHGQTELRNRPLGR